MGYVVVTVDLLPLALVLLGDGGDGVLELAVGKVEPLLAVLLQPLDFLFYFRVFL